MRGMVVAVLVTIALAACSGNSSNTAERSGTTTGQTSTAVSSSTTSGGAPTSPVSIPPTRPTAHLVAVRVARQATFDRVVFEFSERVPGYKVAYTSEPLTDTSGKQVTVAGPATLLVRMESAGGFDLDSGKATYTGPKHVQPAGTQIVEEVAQVDDFEGVLRWAIGLHAPVGFHVSTLASPPRLVIDIPS